MNELERYSELFAHLHTNKRFGYAAPHKAVLLLSVIDLVETGYINSPHISFSDELVKTFEHNWNRYLGTLSYFKPDASKPFFHMQHEPFWCLREREEGFMAMAAEPSLTIRNADKKELPTKGYSKKALRKAFCWAEIDQALFLLMQNKEARAHLRVVLISTFLLNHPQKSNKIAFPSCLLPLLCFLAS